MVVRQFTPIQIEIWAKNIFSMKFYSFSSELLDISPWKKEEKGVTFWRQSTLLCGEFWQEIAPATKSHPSRGKLHAAHRDLYLSSAHEQNPIKLANMNINHSLTQMAFLPALVIIFVTINILLYNLLVWFCHNLINCIMVSGLVLIEGVLVNINFAIGGNIMNTFIMVDTIHILNIVILISKPKINYGCSCKTLKF